MLQNLKKINFSDQDLKVVPEEPGIYIFWSDKKPLYVGKSVNLKHRIKSYKSLVVSGKTAKMVSQTVFFSYIVVASEIEALLFEAKLVSTLQTPFNIQLKDDKNPLYIKITNDKYPLVLTARKINQNDNNFAFFGPFPSSSSVKNTLRLIRKVFPYSQHLPDKRACIYSQMGLCNPCPSNIIKIKNKSIRRKSELNYLHNIKHISKFLNGNIDKFTISMQKEMQNKVKLELFEEAAKIKSQIQAIKYITMPINPLSSFLQNPNFIQDIKNEEVNSLKSYLSKYIFISKLSRIECFDIAHLSGTFPTASMVTFINGSAQKNYYRHFKINQKKTRDDISNISEIAKRRRKHLSDWGKPDLIIVDGGKGQVSAFLEEFNGENIPIVGIAKRTETLVVPLGLAPNSKFVLFKPEGSALHLVQKLRNEAHRFARRLHHKLIDKNLFQIN